MKIMDNVQGTKGITLNLQLVELMNILDGPGSKEEKDAKIQSYLDNLRDIDARYKEASSKGTMSRYEFAINEAVKGIEGLNDEQKALLKNALMQSIPDLSVCDKEVMEQRLISLGLSSDLYSRAIEILGERSFTAKEGILTLTPEKVRKLYDHMFADGNRYDRVTFDNVGKYSGFVGIDGKTVTSYGMDTMTDFCRVHGMKAKVNAITFYADFPQLLEASLDGKVQREEITEEQKRAQIKESFMNYATTIASRYAGQISSLDIFNELVYDNGMLEKRELFEEDDTYHYRTKGWQKYLSLEDLCEMALKLRGILPDVDFTYNEMHWVDPAKRKEMIKTIKRIQEIEKGYRQNGLLLPGDRGLIDSVGIEAHLFTDDSLEEIENAFNEIANETGLPMEITELDVARTGRDPESLSEEKKQQLIFQKIHEMAERPDVKGVTIWSQSDDLSFMNDKCGRKVYASVLTSDFEEKEFEKEQEIDSQSFNYHTHTSLCGHADGTMEEYIQRAIESGFTTLGISDHAPSPIGKEDPHNRMNMEQFQEEYIPALRELREKYKDRIDIKIGLEEEYYGDVAEQMPALIHYRERTAPELDYLILGQHFAFAREDDGRLKDPMQRADSSSAHYPLDYAMTVVEAINSGKYAMVSHPDIFLSKRDNIPPEQREEYARNVKQACEMICEAAKEKGIPLEVNLGAMAAIKAGRKQLLLDGSYPYPVSDFWKVAQEKGCSVVIGYDAHTPKQLLDRGLEEEAKQYLKNHGIDFDFLESFTPKGIGKEGTRKIPLEELRAGLEPQLKDSEEFDRTLYDMTAQMKGQEQTKEEKQGETHDD